MRVAWRTWVVPLAALGGIVLAFYVRAMLLEGERRFIEERFRGDAETVFRSIEREFSTSVETIQALRAFFKGSDSVNAEEFDDFTRLVLDSHPEIEVFLWAEQRGESFVVTYDVPPGRVEPGTDLGADADVRAVIDQAIQSKGPMAAPARDGTILIVGPARSKTQRGIVASRIMVGNAVRAALLRIASLQMDLSLFDLDGSRRSLIWGEDAIADLEYISRISLPGRLLEVHAHAAQGSAGERGTDAPTAVLLSLLAATALAVGYAWNVAGRTARIERVVEERTTTIREVTRLQRAILESAPYAILSFDPAGLILSLNPAAERLLGRGAAEAVGALRLEGFLDGDELASRIPGSDPMRGALLDLANREDDDAWTLCRRDGSRVPVRLSVSVLRRESGEVAGFLAIAHDITARLAAERELKEAKAQAEEASRLKSRFLANMSHEFRTPLTAILGYAEMLEEDSKGADNASAADDCRRIQKAGRHLLRLIDEILDLAKIESGRIELQVESVELGALVEEVEATVRRLAEEKGNRLQVAAAAGEHVRADAMRLKQVLFNLVANAARFTENGTITIGAAREGDDVVLRVRDTGIGMTEAELERVFQPFVQADGSTTRRYGGTGLGLAIARQFTELMGGTLTATSKPGEGSAFTVRLPA